MSHAPAFVPVPKRPVRLLIIDDSAADAELMVAAIERDVYSPVTQHVTSREQFQACLADSNFDVILCDHNLRTWIGRDALDMLKESGKQIPFVVVTGTLGDERAVQYLKDGASDYVLKEHLDRLPAVVDRALSEKERQAENTRLQRAIWAAKKEWERTFDAIPDAIMLLDSGTRVVRANKATTELLGLTFSELIGKRCFEVVHCMSEQRPGCPFQHMLLSNDKAEDEYLEPRLGKTFRVTAIPLRDRDNLTGAIHVLRDITESRRLEETLRQSQKLEAVGRLAGGIAHDFNNILGIVLAYSELLQQQLPAGDSSAQFVEAILESVDQAKRVVAQLLAFSRKQVMQPTLLDLNEVMRECRAMLHRLIREDIELLLEPERDLYPVRADRVQIEQVLINLVVNARDAMPKGGRIVIATANVEVDSSSCAQIREPAARGSYAMFSVTDTGIGMDALTLSHVFEPFFTTKDKEKGTGLGLAIVYGIVRQSGGYISVESNPEQGSTFKIYLPRATGVAETTAKPSASATVLPAESSQTILLVEDEPKLLDVICRMLDRTGYRVLQASNADEAVRVAEEYPDRIDLVLTDVILRGSCDGTELADSLRRSRPETRFLFMSGHSDTLVDQSQRGGHCALLQKPFTTNELHARVREQLAANL